MSYHKICIESSNEKVSTYFEKIKSPRIISQKPFFEDYPGLISQFFENYPELSLISYTWFCGNSIVRAGAKIQNCKLSEQ